MLTEKQIFDKKRKFSKFVERQNEIQNLLLTESSYLNRLNRISEILEENPIEKVMIAEIIIVAFRQGKKVGKKEFKEQINNL